MIRQYAVFAILFLALANVTDAQICGPSRTKIYLLNPRGEVVTGGKVEFTDVKFDMEKLYGNWLTSIDGTYLINFLDNKPYGFHMLRIQASGYLTTEMRISITEAQRQIFRIVLQPVGSKMSNYAEELFTVWGQINSSDGKPILASKIVLSNKQGRQFTTVSAADGSYSLELPDDFYDIDIFRPDGNLAAKFESFRVSNKHIDAVLQSSVNGRYGGSDMVCDEICILRERPRVSAN